MVLYDSKLSNQIKQRSRSIKQVISKLASLFQRKRSRRFSGIRRTDTLENAVVIARDQHSISRTQISPNALKVLYRLKDSGFSAYLVGGSVRDLLLGREPKDFDVVTNAKPEEIRRCFRNCVLIGRRFRLVHVLYKNEIIEVSTFRAMVSPGFEDEAQSDEGMLLTDNIYGTFAEDSLRRDFNINSLYYNIADFSVIDWHQGLADLKQGLLRIIGDPAQRYREDPVRLLRAARIAAKLGFRIQEDSERPILSLGHLLNHVAPARLFNEIEKLFLGGAALESFILLRQYGLFNYLFPSCEQCLDSEAYETASQFITNALNDTDARVRQDKPVTPSYLFAVLLWYPLQTHMQAFIQHSIHSLVASIESGEMDKTHLPVETITQLQTAPIDRKLRRPEAFHLAMHRVLHEQSTHILIPKRFSHGISDIWSLQERFNLRFRDKVSVTLSHPRFRAGFDFLLLRARSGEPISEIAQWWQDFYHADEEKREILIQALPKSMRRRPRRRRPGQST